MKKKLLEIINLILKMTTKPMEQIGREQAEKLVNPKNHSPEYIQLCKLINENPDDLKGVHLTLGKIIKQYPELFNMYGIRFSNARHFVYYNDETALFL